MPGKDLLLVGNRGGSSVGESFERAAQKLHLDYTFLDATGSMVGPRVVQKAYWRLLGRRPVSLRSFSGNVLSACGLAGTRLLLTTGIAPVDFDALTAIGESGAIRCNFLTDDPWSKSNRSEWFLRALKHYDFVFNPRGLVRDDLESHTSAKVVELPFGWDPDLFHPLAVNSQENEKYASDVLFAGGADRDRIPYIAALHESGLRVGLYGSYWERFARTRHITRGKIAVEELPKAIAAAKVGLCLVRRANRDQHCMRTFEVPAVGCCMLMEDTDDHRRLFGPEGAAVLYFREIPEMVTKAKWLVRNDAERIRLAGAAQAVIVSGSHTYQHRLETILDSVRSSRGL
jgi:spore maturation protein CgeB